MNDQADTNTQQRLISEEISKKVKTILAQHLGTEPEDIEDEDSFIDNLNMTPSDIYDFFSLLNESEFDTSAINIKEVETVGDLVEFLSAEESF